MAVFDSTPAVWEILNSDPALLALLTTYGMDAAPAIFTQAPIPTDARPPMIVTPYDISQSPLAVRMDGRHLPIVLRDVSCFSYHETSSLVLDEMADRIHALFYRNGARTGAPSWTDSTYELMETDVASGPFLAPTDESLRGRILTVQMTFRAID